MIAKFSYNKSMLPYFEEGRKKFSLETQISLEGIEFKIEGEHLYVIITEEQQEQYLAHHFLTGMVVQMDLLASEDMLLRKIQKQVE